MHQKRHVKNKYSNINNIISLVVKSLWHATSVSLVTLNLPQSALTSEWSFSKTSGFLR